MNLDTYGTLVAASLVLLLGRQLVLRIAFLRIYSIPEPVVGGLLVALAAWLVNGLADAQVRFDSSLGMPLMLSFFACIGLNADIASLMRGGKPMVRFLFVVVGFLVVQNATGLLLASLQGQPPLLGLLGHLFGQALDLLQHLGRPDMRNAVVTDRHLFNRKDNR